MLEAGRPAADVARVFRVHRTTVGRMAATPGIEGEERGLRNGGGCAAGALPRWDQATSTQRGGASGRQGLA